MSKYLLACASAFSFYCGCVSSASAHAIVGNRIFPATLSVEDPGVSDEFNTQIGRFKGADEDGGPDAWQTNASFDYTKTLTEDLGFSVGGAWLDGHDASGWE